MDPGASMKANGSRVRASASEVALYHWSPSAKHAELWARHHTQWLQKGTLILLNWALIRLDEGDCLGPELAEVGQAKGVQDGLWMEFLPQTIVTHFASVQHPGHVTAHGSLRIGGGQHAADNDVHIVAHEGHGSGGGSSLPNNPVAGGDGEGVAGLFVALIGLHEVLILMGWHVVLQYLMEGSGDGIVTMGL